MRRSEPCCRCTQGRSVVRFREVAAVVVCLGAVTLISSKPASGQGCVCERQNPTVLGGPDGYMHKGQWELTTSFLRFVSDKHYIGTQRNFALTPYAGPVSTRDQFNVDLTYAFSTRWTVSLDVPVQIQSYDLHRVLAASGSTQPVPINTGADGIGDITVRAGYWLLSTEHMRGNVFVSLGLELPTGNDDATSLIYGRAVPVDISVQPGNGAWGFIPTVQAFRDFRRISLYALGTYLINPRDTTGTPAFFNALSNPATTTVNSSTDQYFAEVGAAVPIKLRWVTPTLAYRVSGVPVRDLIGGSDGFRRPATLAYAAPGLNIFLRGHVVNLSVPIVSYVNVKPHIVNGVNQNTDATVPGFMFAISYPLRFGGR